MRRVLKKVFMQGARTSGSMMLHRAITRDQFRIVTYHGVDAAHHPVVNFDRLQTDPKVFAQQVEGLARRFRVVDLKAAVRHYMEKGTWPERSLAITFDDGYRNNLEQAAPILQRLGLPATFFVTAGFIDGRVQPWWYHVRMLLSARKDLNEKQQVAEAIRIEAELRPMTSERRVQMIAGLEKKIGENSLISGMERYLFMSREACRNLLAMGFDVQGHGDTHVSFFGESTEVVCREIQQSAVFIRELGHVPWALAYPYGHEPGDPITARAMLAHCGFVAAVTTRACRNKRGVDCYELCRFDLHGGYTPLAAQFNVS